MNDRHLSRPRAHAGENQAVVPRRDGAHADGGGDIGQQSDTQEERSLDRHRFFTADQPSADNPRRARRARLVLPAPRRARASARRRSTTDERRVEERRRGAASPTPRRGTRARRRSEQLRRPRLACGSGPHLSRSVRRAVVPAVVAHCRGVGAVPLAPAVAEGEAFRDEKRSRRGKCVAWGATGEAPPRGARSRAGAARRSRSRGGAVCGEAAGTEHGRSGLLLFFSQSVGAQPENNPHVIPVEELLEARRPGT